MADNAITHYMDVCDNNTVSKRGQGITCSFVQLITTKVAIDYEFMTQAQCPDAL